MAKITVIGGTGYAGSVIAQEAAKRGHAVTALSRKASEQALDGVTYVQGSALDGEALATAIAGSDVVVAALSPRGDMVGKVGSTYKQLAGLADKAGARLVIIGGWSTLRPAPDAPRFVEGEVPEQFAAEAREVANVFLDLEQNAPATLDWLFVSPAAEFGGLNPGEATGKYRVGGEVALFDENGKSAISGADFARGVVDEIETPAHHRTIISLAY